MSLTNNMPANQTTGNLTGGELHNLTLQVKKTMLMNLAKIVGIGRKIYKKVLIDITINTPTSPANGKESSKLTMLTITMEHPFPTPPQLKSNKQQDDLTPCQTMSIPFKKYTRYRLIME